MKKRTLIIVGVVAALLSAGAAAGALALITTGVGPVVGDCKTYRIADSGGRVGFPVPTFCREDICEISVGWWGDPVGAFSSGLTWELNFVQWNDGNWQAGPAACVGGVCLTAGHGQNGNGIAEAVAGPWSTGLVENPASTWFELWDDLAPENNPLRMTFQLHQGDPANPRFTSVILFICPE